jgi:hypothetical protein
MWNYALPVPVDPAKERLYIVTHAEYTHVTFTNDYGEAKGLLRALGERRGYVEKNVRPKIEESITSFMPDFAEKFEYADYFVSMKTKILTTTEFRGSYVWKEPAKRLLHVFSGKIDTIFEAGDQVRKLLRNSSLSLEEVTSEGGTQEIDGSKVVPKILESSEGVIATLPNYDSRGSYAHATLYSGKNRRTRCVSTDALEKGRKAVDEDGNEAKVSAEGSLNRLRGWTEVLDELYSN